MATDDTERYYNERASVYDETAGYTNPETQRLQIPIIERYQEIFKGKRVVDIACGTGYWTAFIGETAEAVMGIDNSRSSLAQAYRRCLKQENVRFLYADALTLSGVPAMFNAAFAHWWWSHIPKKNIKSFLTALHSKLEPRSVVLFNDQLPYLDFVRKKDSEGNNLEKRVLPNGRTFMIIKNYPDEEEIKDALSGFAEDIQYRRLTEEKSWEVVYKLKKRKSDNAR